MCPAYVEKKKGSVSVFDVKRTADSKLQYKYLTDLFIHIERNKEDICLSQ